VVLKTNEIHRAASMTQYGQSEMRPICERETFPHTPPSLVLSEAVLGRAAAAAGRGAPLTVAPAFALLRRGRQGRQRAPLL
jgi:hypothetical protein